MTLRAALSTALAGLAAMAALLTAAAPASARGLSLGFFDQAFTDPVRAPQLVADAARSGAGIVRIQGDWGVIARSRPADPADPADPAYDWAALDAAVRAAADRRLTVLLSFARAPAWAEGAGRPQGAPRGTWRPDAAAYGVFARAAAVRFSGTYTPPGHSFPLPRVRYWQAWNEPNLDRYLTPQWVPAGGGMRAESPRLYRRLQNAFYAGVKSVSRLSVVLAAGTAPYGDPQPGGRRIMPVRFLREALCLSRTLRPRRCPERIRFDVLDHHPYGVRGPYSHSLNRDDASVPDVRKLTRVVRAALRHRRLLPRRPKRVWVTEISWDSSPPDPEGVPLGRHARWLAQSLEVLWRQGVDTVLWYRVRDEARGPSYAETYQSGILDLAGAPKPAARAFRFPLVLRPRGSRVALWTRSPATGRLVVKAGHRTVVSRRVRRGQVVAGTFRRRPGRWRATAAGLASPSWRIR